MESTKIIYLFSFLALSLIPSISAAQLPGNQDWLDYNASSGKFRLKQEPTLAAWPAATQSPYIGVYLWEFGDGNYSFEESPTHQYTKAGKYQVRLHLTPFYSITGPITLRGTADARASGRAQRPYKLYSRNTYIETNTDDYIVPGQLFQVVLHFEMPAEASGGGYLLFFYNNKKDLSLARSIASSGAFEFMGERSYGSASGLSKSAAKTTLSTSLSGDKWNNARAIINQYKDMEAYRVEDMKAGQQDRVFFTLEAKKTLKSLQDKNRSLSIAAIWMPDKASYSRGKMFFEKKLQILAVYDPNRIRVSPRQAKYRRGHPKVFTYHVDFQNKEKGRVQDVRVDIPLGNSLDHQTVKVTATEPEMQECPTGVSLDTVQTPCVLVDTISGDRKDSIRIILHNIGLEGTKSEGLESRKSTKGSVEFEVLSVDSVKVPVTQTRAYIFFDAVKPVKTRNATIKWRRLSFYYRQGYNFGYTNYNQDINFIEGTSTGAFAGQNENFNFSLGLKNAPIRTGLAYGGELHYNFYRRLVREFYQDGAVNNDIFSWRQERLDGMGFVEARGWVGYQFRGFVRGFATGGFSMPVTGEVGLRHGLGYFDENNERAQLGDEFQYSTDEMLLKSLGFVTQLGVEVGVLDFASVGISHDLRVYPDFYEGQRIAIDGWNVGLRIKLFSMGSKKPRK